MYVDTVYHVQYWDTQEQYWKFGIVPYDELQRLLSNPRYEMRHYCSKQKTHIGG